MWHGDQYGPDQDAINRLSAENADLHNEKLALTTRVRALEAALRHVQLMSCLYNDDGACTPGCGCHVEVATAALNGPDGEQP